jgi:hypothetical protein
MSYIEISTVQHSTIISTFSEREEIIVDPEYQRNGGVWTTEKKQLLIDSILNKYDIPKIYFHQFDRNERAESGKSYAIIDGKQRLETIWGFIDGEFCISNDFEYQYDRSINLSGLSYDDLGKEYPKIKIKFDSYVLPIVGVMTDDLDLIEDMFSRLNEAVPLNSAEKRNAFGGDMVKAIRNLSHHAFFENHVRFKNTRYQHFEVAARFLLVESSNVESEKLIDTKKVYLDAMAKNYKAGKLELVSKLEGIVSKYLDQMTKCFTNQDVLLRAQGSMVLYYLIFKWAEKTNLTISRAKLLAFDEIIKANRKKAEVSYEEADYDYLEYDRLSQHGTNDVSNIKERVRILKEYLEE